MKNEFLLSPVGRLRTQDGKFFLDVETRYIPALNGLDAFSHVNVLWWAHFLDEKAYRKIVTTKKPYKKGPSEIGIFATRSPIRPNPIALSVCPLAGIDHRTGVVELASIDAEHGTPILDIKPYHPATDRVRKTSVPEWCRHWPEWYEDSADFDWLSELNCPR